VESEGLQGFPTKNGIILVLTVTGWGIPPRYTVLETNISLENGWWEDEILSFWDSFLAGANC